MGLKLALWAEEMKRHRARLEEARRQISVGKISGAVGTHATVPLEVEDAACRRLRLEPAAISSQIVQRDRHAQFVLTLALISCSLEKFATEIRGLQRTEVREVAEPFEPGQTGSSAMPHKRNPELCERICGLSRLLRGFSVTAMENIALWHERDISHSSTERIILPDSSLAVDYVLHLFTYIVKELQVYPEHMDRNMGLTRGLVFSQRVMLALIEKGLGREQAYKTVQGHAMAAWQGDPDFLSRLKADSQVTSVLPPQEMEALFDYGFFVRRVREIFQRLQLGESR
jgi:adenylosuccinate lyase